ncbi:nuclear transport factor 2 family protein [Sorangium sp. So ce1099]|uniref:nuclear transport factor 2 family protein n=1 Tax=Sorangium sp. So ce1099 TaxID=3133331 RepID=UPI003F5FD895
MTHQGARIALGAAAAALIACASPTGAVHPGAQEVPVQNATRDRAAVMETIHNVARGADLRQWDTVRAAFAERVVLDYGVPELLTPEEIISRWQPLLSAFDSTQHVVREEQVSFVEPDLARVRSRFQAAHHLAGAAGGELWSLGGRYEHELARTPSGWKVTRMRMIPGESSGNAALIDRARERAGLAAPRGPAYRVEHVRFSSEGAGLVGLLHLPARAQEEADERLPAVAVLGSWTTVKEQMPSLYAQRLASAGFAALTFDFRGFGESEGAPRHAESPARKIEDIRAAVAFLSTHPAVDARRLGLVGICASSGYVAAEAASDPRVRSVVMVAPWLHDAALAASVYGGAEGVADRIRKGREAHARFEATGVVSYVPAVSTTDVSAAMVGPFDYYLDARRGGIPQWGNRFAVMSWPGWLEFDALASAPRLRAPTLIVHSEQGAIPDGAKRFAAAMPVAPRVVWTAGTQFHFYDDPATVDRASQEAVAHLRATLAAR